MSWRARLPPLPRPWRWLCYDPSRHLVLAHCCYGRWLWFDRDYAEGLRGKELRALRDAMRRSTGLRGQCNARMEREGDSIWCELVVLPPPIFRLRADTRGLRRGLDRVRRTLSRAAAIADSYQGWPQ